MLGKQSDSDNLIEPGYDDRGSLACVKASVACGQDPHVGALDGTCLMGSCIGCAGHGWEYHGGTLVYTAPELILAARSKPEDHLPPCYLSYAPPADCWAFGLTAFRLLTGGRLFVLGEDATLSDIGSADPVVTLQKRHLADLHADWVRAPSACFTISAKVVAVVKRCLLKAMLKPTA
jgi:hypothetical protein